jgi:hypothetical protein
VCREIGLCSEPKGLFAALADGLHGVVQFDFIGVSLRDEEGGTFQNYCMDMTNGSDLISEKVLAPEETLTLWVYDRQEPLLRSTGQMEPRYGRFAPFDPTRNRT